MAVGFKSQLKKDSWMRHTRRGSAVIERLGAVLSTCMQTVQSGLEEVGITHVVYFAK